MGVFGGESKMPKKAFLTPPPKKGFFSTIFGAFLAIFSKIPLLPRFIRLWDNSNIYRFFPHICWVLLEKAQRALWWHSDTRLARLAKQKKLLQVFISDGRNSKELSALPIEVEAELKTAAAVRWNFCQTYSMPEVLMIWNIRLMISQIFMVMIWVNIHHYMELTSWNPKQM